ncbi:Cell surface glycoprotein [uncultured archaeon]|nr:Cell surface glycoprotein [uncultured archaeon]
MWIVTKMILYSYRGLSLRIAFVIMGLIFLAGGASAVIYTVCSGGCNFTRIQDAIYYANTTDGDTILVYNDTIENVNVNKSLTLRGIYNGHRPPAVVAQKNGSSITLSADGITIDGFIIINSGVNEEGDDSGGVYITSNNNSILNNSIGFSVNGNIYSNINGIYISSSYNNTIINNSINNNQFGIYIKYSSQNLIANNTFTYDGIFVNNAYQNIVTGNTVNGKPLLYYENDSDKEIKNAGQVILVNDTNFTLENLDLSDTTIGAELWNTSLSTVANNSFSDNYCGIFLSNYSSLNNITNNTFTNDGMFVYSSYQNNVTNNTVNGKPLVYLENLENVSYLEAANAGQVILVNDINITLENLNLSNTFVGVELWGTSQSTVANNSLNSNKRGIYLNNLSNNDIIQGNTASNNADGMFFDSFATSFSTFNNIISNNTACNNSNGVYLQNSNNNIVTNNIRHNPKI